MQSTGGRPRCRCGDCRIPAGLRLSRYLSPGGDRAGNARQMALSRGWQLCSLRGAFKKTN